MEPLGSKDRSTSVSSLTKEDSCVCLQLHVECDPQTCDKAADAKTANPKNQLLRRIFQISDFKKAKGRGCTFCTIFYDGLMLPEIRYVWWLEKARIIPEDEMQVHFLDRRLLAMISDDPQAWNAWYWRHFSFYREPGLLGESSPCRAFPMETSASEHSASDTSWKNLRGWLDACEKHEACRRGGLVPKRVIDVGVGEDADARLLCDSDVPEGRYYTTLSYCWGKDTSKLPKTTTENLEQRKERVKWSELPKTFREAINITRTLKVRYIWIDALCIIQDDPHDWEIQASQMSLVYQNSYLTIAASHASDSNGGLFTSTSKRTGKNSSFEIHPSSSVRVRRIHREDHYDYGHHWARQVSSKPLHTRGWALQERLLSPRILHYTATELVWECNTLVDCQCGGIHVMGAFKPPFAQTLLGNADNISRTHNWLWVIEVYTNQNLTYPTDRLPALSGLARQAQAAGWGQYAAGLWRQDLEYLVCWDVKNKRTSTRCPEYLGPSWSWVNILGAVTFTTNIRQAQRQFMKMLISIQDLSITTGEDHTGKVLDGHIIISGRSLDATLSMQGNRLTMAHGDVYDRFEPDSPINDLDKPSTTLAVKLVLWCTWDGGKPLYMVLRPARDRKDVEGSIDRSSAFERLGMIYGETRGKWVDQTAPFENLIFV